MRCLAVAALASCVAASAAASQPMRFAQGWQHYSPSERYKALQHYHQHQQLPEQRQQNIERNYERWRAMPEQERDRIRKNYEQFRQLPPQQRDRLKQRYRSEPPPPPPPPPPH